MSERAFPILRWVGLVYVLGWAPVYAAWWKGSHFLYLCNVAVFLTAAGLWFGSSLLLSSQAVGSLVIGLLWTLNVTWSVVNHGRGLMGGTEYMFDASCPLWVRLLSFDHLAVPAAALWGVKKLGYDQRAFRFQSAVAAVVMVAARTLAPGENLNFVEKELVTYRTWGPVPVHLAFIWMVLVFVVYWPIHAMLERVMPNQGERGRVA